MFLEFAFLLPTAMAVLATFASVLLLGSLAACFTHNPKRTIDRGLRWLVVALLTYGGATCFALQSSAQIISDAGGAAHSRMVAAGQAVYTDQIMGNPLVTPAILNGQSTTQMPLTELYRHWDIIMTGSATTTTHDGTPYIESTANLMALITVVPAAANGAGITEQFKSANAAHFAFRTILNDCPGGLPFAADSPLTTGAANPIAIQPRIYFSEPGAPNPDNFALDARHLSSLNLNIQWRDGNALGAPASGTTAVTAQVEVKARCLKNIPAAANGANLARKYVREIQDTQLITNSQLGYIFQNMRSNATLRRLFIKATQGTVNYADPSDSLLGGSTARLEGPHIGFQINQTEVLMDAIYSHLQDTNVKDYGLTIPWPVGRLVFQPQSPIDLNQYKSFNMIADTLYNDADTNMVEFTYNETGSPIG